MPQLWKSAKDADSHSCLENSPQKTLRVSHIPTAPAANIYHFRTKPEKPGRHNIPCTPMTSCNIYVQSRAAGERVIKSVTSFVDRRLRLRVNAEKSAVARPWQRKFLGYSMTWHKQPRLKVADASIRRFKDKLRALFREGRGRNLKRFIEELTPVLRGWMNYFRLAEVKGIFEELDGWLRRKLRCLLWRQWKRNFTRAKALMRRGLENVRSWRSATNGRGPWWNSGASHMNDAFPKTYFDRMGLVSLLSQLRRLQST